MSALGGPKYPHITVELSGGSGNAFAIIGGVSKALLRAGVAAEEIETFKTEAKSGDYDHVIQTAMRTVVVE